MIKLAEKYDKNGNRTIGVITKVDSASKEVIKTYENEFIQKNRFKKHGFFTIINYTKGDEEKKLTI
jgi:hypothetical protein